MKEDDAKHLGAFILPFLLPNQPRNINKVAKSIDDNTILRRRASSETAYVKRLLRHPVSPSEVAGILQRPMKSSAGKAANREVRPRSTSTIDE